MTSIEGYNTITSKIELRDQLGRKVAAQPQPRELNKMQNPNHDP